MKIILIEDDPLIQIELKLLLIELGHEVVGEFDRYEQVKENLSEFSDVDLAFIDIQLASAFDGTDVAELLQKNHPMHLVFLTSKIDERVLAKSNQLKIDDFLAKPFRTEDILICLVNTEKEKRLVLLPLKEFVSKFTNPNILQVHRSYVINVSKIESIQSSELKIGKNAIPIGESFKAKLFELLNISH